MKQVRFPEGCAMSLYIPLILLPNDGNPIDPTKLTDLEASVSLHGVVTQITPSIADACIVLPLSADLKAGQYVITYSFKYDGRPFAGRWANVLEIVKDNAQSNWQGYIPEDGKATLEDQIFIAGPTMTDEELEQLKAEYVEKNKELQHAIDEYREKAESIEDIEGAKLAFNTMKRIQPYLYGIEYNSLNYEDARAHMLGASVMPSSCTTIKRGSEVGRNFDWTISKQVEFLVRTKAHNGRYATIGFCGALPTLTEDVVAGGQYRDEYRYLPFYMQDGMNSEGLVATIHQLPYNATRSQAAEGYIPRIKERERISALMLVRYVLDNFNSAGDAAAYIRDYVRVIPAKVDGKQLDCHFSIADKNATIYIAFEGTEIYAVRHEASERFVMTNFRLKNTTLVDGRYDIEQSGIEDYGQGVERANAAIDSDLDILSILAQEVNFTKAYTGLFLTEFAGMESEGVRATIHDTAALRTIQAKAATMYDNERMLDELREKGDLWQTVHSVVYDLNAKTMRFVTQEIDEDEEPVVIEEPFAAAGGGISPEQYEALAKQGDNPEATNTAIAALAASIGEKVGTLTALDSDIKAGKEALAREITGKGQPTSKDDTLIQMASAVQRIQHENVELDASGMYSKQLFGGDPDNSPLWNLYDVLAQMKNKYLGLYPGLIVCEYYKGYNSLQLQGADAYFTCDGDEYDYDALHTWHDSDNGRANRWVCFLFRSEAAEFNIVNTDISPRSMYVGGHIGVVRYFINNRLTEFVSGIEDTDIVDLLIPYSVLNFGKDFIIRGVKKINESVFSFTDYDGLLIIISDIESAYQFIGSGASLNVEEIYLPKIKEVLGYDIILRSNSTCKFRTLYMPNLTSCMVGSRFFLLGTSFPNVIDIEVGAMETNLRIADWNPTNVLADETKKAQLLDNILHHIAEKVSDRTGQTPLTFTISANIKSVILSQDPEGSDGSADHPFGPIHQTFYNKNWNIA